MKNLLRGVFVLFVFLPFGASAADLTATPISDTYVWLGGPEQNYGMSESIVVERVNAINYTRLLLNFDLSSIPANATISSAILTLTPYHFTGSGNVQMTVKRVTDAWDESAVTWNAQPGTNEIIADVLMDDFPEVKSWNLTAAAQKWVSGEWANRGFMMFGPENFSQTYRRSFWSKDGIGAKPALAVTYSVPVTPPPPAATSTPPVTLPVSSPHPDDGALLKLSCPAGAAADHPCRAVYYIDRLGARHAFPHSSVFLTWYPAGFSSVTIREVSADALLSYPRGRNVTHRPGSTLFKSPADPIVYVPTLGTTGHGIMRAIKDPAVAAALFGADWTNKVLDFAEVFMTTSYEAGAPINAASDYNLTAESARAETIDAAMGL